ncbi:hypothetical protein C2E23DRAFT_843611 [Lenzites betulinus]|nr:hypothetical protein C2E23DRAFT_843611 [Lenzites betulinus]
MRPCTRSATPLLIARFLLNLLAIRQPSNESADAIDLFSTDVTGGFTASDVVESFVYPDQDGSTNMARRSAGSLHFV